MITKIGVIYQDLNSLGFLRGLRDRLKCEAEFIDPPVPIGNVRVLPRRKAKDAWRYFQKRGVDLVVRFTDADQDRWQDIRRKELERIPTEARSVWICGVAVSNPEDWLCLDVDYLVKILQRPREELVDATKRTGAIKHAITSMQHHTEGLSDVVARIVRDAPPKVFRRWLQDEALRTFYSDCRDAAKRAECETPNELEAPSDA